LIFLKFITLLIAEEMEMGELKALCEFCGLAAADNHKNGLCITAAGIKARKDFADGLETGNYSPYYPLARREIVLANIAKVSPAFVRGYLKGEELAKFDDWASQYEPDDLSDLDDGFYNLNYRSTQW
jgi:hypothetical protein